MSDINKNFEIPANIFKEWQEIVDLLAELIDVSVGLIMRITEPDIEVFASSDTHGNPYKKGDQEVLQNSGLYCEEVIKQKKMLMVPNALCSKRWKDNPDIKLNMISYLGYPLFFPDGEIFGTICVLDIKGNTYSKTFIRLIMKFAWMVETHIASLYMNKILGDKNKTLSDYTVEIKTLRGIIPICSHCKKIRDDKGYWKQIEQYIHEHSDAIFSHSICRDCAIKHYPDMDIYEEK